MADKPIKDKDLENISGGGGVAFGDNPQPPSGGGGGGDFGGSAEKPVGINPVEEDPSGATKDDSRGVTFDTN